MNKIFAIISTLVLVGFLSVACSTDDNQISVPQSSADAKSNAALEQAMLQMYMEQMKNNQASSTALQEKLLQQAQANNNAKQAADQQNLENQQKAAMMTGILGIGTTLFGALLR
jgi:hypothetical protein